MGALGDFAVRVRGYFSTAGRGMGRAVGRSGRDLVVTVEERPDLGPLDVSFPYPLPTREEPLAYVLFLSATLTLVVSVLLVAGYQLALGHVPPGIVMAVGAVALALGVLGNMTVIALFIEDNSTQLLRPLVGAGVPLLRALHYWFNPIVAGLVLVFVLVHSSNNLLMPAVAIVLLVWAVTGLLLKLPRDSPWNGPMLRQWCGLLHRRPFVYVVLVAMAFVSVLADVVR